MAGQRNSYGKRSHSQSDYADNGGSKRRNPGDDRESYAPGSDDTLYRFLCPGKKIGSIIGRGGDIIKKLRSETQAKIRVGESVPGCEERVITIFSTNRESNTSEDTGDKVCPAQDALFRVYECLITDIRNEEDDIDAGNPEITIRLLVPSDQIGCIIGRGGQIIQGIRSDTGAQIRILKNDHLPACAISGDELIQITDDAPIVRKALIDVSSRIHDNPSRSHHLLVAGSSQVFPMGGQFGVANAGGPVVGLGSLMSSYGSYKGDASGDWSSFYPSRREESSTKEFTLRLLCPSANIGGVIGKSGVVIKQIRQESGASIKVDSSSTEDDCTITISAKEYFEDPISSAIDAAVRLQPRCSEKTERESGDLSYTTRLLVPTSRIGCLIGKGGSIISEMRRSTRANIRILSKENLPKVAAEDDEMVQISGDLEVAKTALVQIATRLKANFFEREGALSAFPSMPYHSLQSSLSDGSRYASRESKVHSRGYSYSGGSSSDLRPSDSYGSYGGSQVASSIYGAYDGYYSRSGSAGLSGPNPVSHVKHHGY